MCITYVRLEDHVAYTKCLRLLYTAMPSLLYNYLHIQVCRRGNTIHLEVSALSNTYTDTSSQKSAFSDVQHDEYS
jgi:hypothetical protein